MSNFGDQSNVTVNHSSSVSDDPITGVLIQGQGGDTTVYSTDGGRQIGVSSVVAEFESRVSLLEQTSTDHEVRISNLESP